MSNTKNAGTAEADEELRAELERRMKAGLKTIVEPRAYEHEQVLAIVNQLQHTAKDDYDGKLRISGFTLNPYNPTGEEEDEQACDTCMYYVIHRRFCELPELMLPVEAKWSCRLWRI